MFQVDDEDTLGVALGLAIELVLGLGPQSSLQSGDGFGFVLEKTLGFAQVELVLREDGLEFLGLLESGQSFFVLLALKVGNT